MENNPKWSNLKARKEVGWLSEPLKGKMKGIQQAAKLYEMSFQYPDYKRLTILELLDRLKESNEEIILNAAWMLLKLVDLNPDLLFKNLDVIKTPIKLNNKQIRIYLGSIIKSLALINSKKVRSALTSIVELVDDSNDDVKLIGSQIFLIISKDAREKIEISKQLTLLNDKNKQVGLNAVETLINVSESKKTTPVLYEKLFVLVLYPQLKVRVYNLIFRLIEKNPEESLSYIKKQLSAQKIMIRRNSLIFLTQFLDKKFDYLTKAIPELSNCFIEEYDAQNLVLISSIVNELAEFYPNKFTESQVKEFIENKKKFKKGLKVTWMRIILNLLRYHEKIEVDLEEMKKYLEKQIKKGDYNNRLAHAIACNRILMWNDDYGPSIKMMVKILDNFPLEDNGELYFWVGFNYHAIGDFKNAIPFFIKGIKSKKEYFSSLNMLYAAYEYLLTHKLKKATEILENHQKTWLSNLDVLNLIQKSILLRLEEYIKSIIKLDNDNARANLEKYLSRSYFNCSWDKRYGEVEVKNLNDIITHYKKLANFNG